MKTTRRRVMLAATAVALGAMLGFSGMTVSAQTTSPPPVKALTMQQLNQRTPTFQGQEFLKNGDVVTISDDGAVTGKTFQGTYVYRPAGSIVSMGNMYVRWRDGLVAVTPHLEDGKFKGACDCTYVEQLFDTFKGPEDRSKSDSGLKDIMTLVGEKQTLKPLATELTDNTILRIPGNAWLFKDLGNGRFITLVDAFVWQSGEAPIGVKANAG